MIPKKSPTRCDLRIPPAYIAKLPAVTKTTNLLPLRTPYAGVVVASDIVAGEVVDANKLLFTIADPRSMWLLLSVRQEDARYVTAGLPVEFRTDDGSQVVKGKISWISPAVDERSRTLRVCVFAGNTAGTLRDKTYGTGRILLRVEPRAVVVPREALQSTTDAHFVFVRDRDYRFQAGALKRCFTSDRSESVPGVNPATSGDCWPVYYRAKLGHHERRRVRAGITQELLLRSSLGAAITAGRTINTVADGLPHTWWVSTVLVYRLAPAHRSS